ncbi:GntR family transcriptional regulator [Paenibacillaceae bacterium]|nr:GntR family transcriptional regulator [Paenibacillaceae bacterium]
MTNKNKRIPHYLQIRSFITDQIDKHILQAGDRLPSENDLAAKFGVSRITVKNALDSLVKLGTIHRIQGKGSFVSSKQGVPILYEKKSTSLPLIYYIVPSMENSFTARLLKGVEKELSLSNYKVIFSTTNGCQEREKELIRDALQLGVQGILVFPVDGEKYNEEIFQLSLSGFPIVLIDRDLVGLSVHCVCSDHFGGAYQATRHLIELGHQNIGFLSFSAPATASKEERISGYEKALAEARLPIMHQHRQQFKNVQDIVVFLEKHPEITAIFAENAGTGQILYKAAKIMGISIPEELSVIFFDDFEYPNLAETPPSIVLQQVEGIGSESAKLLLSIINNPTQEKQKILLPTELLLRSSTAPPSRKNNN